MSERFTAKDVRGIFATFTEVAQRAGFNTEHWVLREGDEYTYWQHFTRQRPDGSIGGLSDTEFNPRLGSTTREAYRTLQVRIQTLQAIAELKRSTKDGQ